ncbi:sulfotransferase family protein [Pseudomonas paralactis]|nr:sulfotransferase [Pseudomonas paralactis]
MFDPIFVCGCPRSGNSLVGELLGTSSDIVYAGELGVFYFALQVAPQAYLRTPTPFKDAYHAAIVTHAMSFAEQIKHQNNAGVLCESTPWNVRIMDKLRVLYPNAVFVFMLRHFTGVIQSLRRSWADGYPWAGPTDSARAELWCEMNDYILEFQGDGVIAISYDALCEEPANCLTKVRKQLMRYGILADFDLSVLGVSHASTAERPTIFDATSAGKENTLRAIRSFDPDDWCDSCVGDLSGRLLRTHALLCERFPDDYKIPRGYEMRHKYSIS